MTKEKLSKIKNNVFFGEYLQLTANTKCYDFQYIKIVLKYIRKASTMEN